MTLSLLGQAGVWAAVMGSVWLAIRGRNALRETKPAPYLASAARLMLWGAVAAMVALELALLTDDFTIEYVANHHATTTPFPFDVATAWAALEGSIVLWGLVLAGFTWAMVRSHRADPTPLSGGALAVMGVIGVFFFGLVATVANPFQVCTEAAAASCLASSAWPFAAIAAPLEGPGPNPLLQNHILMAIHPPMLYLGYVGMSVPFAYAISSLWGRLPGREWLEKSRRSTLIAWSFLTLGIVLGGWWAYDVLTWGGYWAWDPVENASFMPWLVATAFLHSALVQLRKGALQSWNYILVIGAFSLTILGTFITRSGTIASVHSFTQSAIGPALLGFLVITLAGSFALFASRAELVASPPSLDSLASREGGFLLNNLLLTVYAFVVLVGTLFPIILEAFVGQRVGVGPPFFNRIAVPLSFALLLAMGVGPITPWTRTTWHHVWSRVKTPLALALGIGVVVAVVVAPVGWVVLSVVISSLVILVLSGHLFGLASRAARARDSGIMREAVRLAGAEPGYWAGQMAHIGVALVVLGIGFASNLADHAEVTLAPGESTSFVGYELTYLEPLERVEPNRTVLGGRVAVTKDGRHVTTLEPRANYFGSDPSGIVSPAVHNSAAGDLYLTLRSLRSESIELALDTSPMIWLLWLGGLVTAAAGFWSVLARRGSRRRTEERAGV